MNGTTKRITHLIQYRSWSVFLFNLMQWNKARVKRD